MARKRSSSCLRWLAPVRCILVLPITITIVIPLAILVFSYRQVIDAYPGGGGALRGVTGPTSVPGPVVANAGALAVDYTLTVAVSIAAGEPIVAFIDRLREHHDKQVVVLIPVALPDRLRYEFLHNHFDLVLTAALRARPDVVSPGSPFRCT